jgi:hypothetical protein
MQRWTTTLAALAIGWAGAAGAVTVPFTENFAGGVAGWEDNANDDLDFVAAGGPDGSSYASGGIDFTGFVPPFPGAGPIVLRAHDEDGASGGAFVGSWNTAGVTQVRAFVRHDAPVPLSWVLRVATTANFPGAVFTPAGTTVAPDSWQEIVFDVDPASPDCTPETGNPSFTCEDALDVVAHFQLGVDAPEAVIEDEVFVTVDVDRVRLLSSDCADGIDNDGDSFVDQPADPGCADEFDLSELNPLKQCDDGADNDGDAAIDHPDDPHCSSPLDNKEKQHKSCGLGFELALLLPLLRVFAPRRRSGRPARAARA